MNYTPLVRRPELRHRTGAVGEIRTLTRTRFERAACFQLGYHGVPIAVLVAVCVLLTVTVRAKESKVGEVVIAAVTIYVIKTKNYRLTAPFIDPTYSANIRDQFLTNYLGADELTNRTVTAPLPSLDCLRSRAGRSTAGTACIVPTFPDSARYRLQ